ncbi:MAG: hypothetical protein ACYDHO_04225, partial [Gaiellaceae bacterium]
VLIVSVTPRESATFPVQLTILIGYNTDYQALSATNQDISGGSIIRAYGRSALTKSVRSNRRAAARTSCSGEGAKIVTSSSSGEASLIAAIMNNPAPCATYYISFAPIKTTNSVDPRPNSAARLLALNKNKVMRKHRAKFVPMAEVNYGAIADRHISFLDTSRLFASKMKRLGYQMWSIDEAPCDLLNGPSDSSWKNLAQLANGLSSKGRVKGVIFNCYQRHGDSLQKLKKYKTSLKHLFRQQTGKTNFDWETLSSATAMWAQEDYTLCSRVCNGGKLKIMTKYSNAYMQHPARLAFARDVPDGLTQAKSFLTARFLNLTNAWAPVPTLDYPTATHLNPRPKPIPRNSGDPAYGTYDLSVTQVKRLASLQISAARAWNNSQHPYSGARIGIRWTDRLDERKTSNGKARWGAGKRAALAARVAAALAGAYGQGGSARKACDPLGVKTLNCRPNAGGTFTNDWSIFRYWSRLQAQECRPSNDNIADAKSLDGASDSVEGTTDCATWENGETAPAGGNKSVWYRWKPPQDERLKFVSAYSADGYLLQTNVYSGDSFGNLSLVYQNNDACGGFRPTGGNYAIQVVNTNLSGQTASAGAFALQWGTGGCYN